MSKKKKKKNNEVLRYVVSTVNNPYPRNTTYKLIIKLKVVKNLNTFDHAAISKKPIAFTTLTDNIRVRPVRKWTKLRRGTWR